MEELACKDKYEHPVPEVMYITSNIPGPGIDTDDFESEFIIGCPCEFQCSNCPCTGGSANYKDGIIVKENLTGPIYECNARCTCVQNCGNRVVQNGPLDCLTIEKVSSKGFGLLTTKLIKKGQFICEYAGEVISISEARRRVESNKRNNTMNYVLVVCEHTAERTITTCIDPKYFGNIGRYANHSCMPNTNLVPVRIEGIVPRLSLFASRDVYEGEEITFNYAGDEADSVHGLSETPCLCGSTNCSGYLPHNHF